MAFSKPTQPGQTQYPNLLPAQAYGYPDGSLLALLAREDQRALVRVVDEFSDEYVDRLLITMQAYQDSIARDERDPEKDLATFLLKKPEMWIWHVRIFAKDCDSDWTRFTLLTERFYSGDLTNIRDEQGVPYDRERVKAIWAVAARALGVIRPQPSVAPEAGLNTETAGGYVT